MSNAMIFVNLFIVFPPFIEIEKILYANKLLTVYDPRMAGNRHPKG
jgi:hypothetical protein